MSAAERPTQVKDWVSRRRDHTPNITNLHMFTRTFSAWWIDINPIWRQEEVPMQRMTDGDWGCLDITGRNWMLNVLICLKWWVDMDIKKGNDVSDDWLEAVADVSWVLNRIEG
ncbi:hypothetical protein C8R43DRAFT_881754 [Mycena crocata]|nr:hypothetical protein C8R43DRAFT_881754 [Mycena crocata]